MQDSKQRDKEELKFLGGQVLLLVTLAINILSALATTLMIFRLGITEDTRVLKSDPESNQISINQNVLSDSLLLSQGDLRSRVIEAERILIDSPASRFQDSSAQILMQDNSISMLAKSFSALDMGDTGLSFTIPKRVDVLEVPPGINNIRAIRSQMRRENNQAQREPTDLYNLDIISSGSLELSGNLGVSMHSKYIDIESHDSITLTSNKQSIIVSADRGIYLPSIEVSQRHVQNAISGNSDVERKEGYELCIDVDGMIYKSVHSCR